ncbi:MULTISPECIES: radical SAM protein [unclassified Oceanispirochaeta]|uniref:B12-binding domain-containing radical SAM protein n=1 Tax=unclassified Oceanispirochaeta TaxID=2635722 RepID=UPI000E0988C7|nr:MULTISPECIES: radical SAM protein [unclassified Oceanispirochaeta]MBF9014072.1 radical SAM protein [Oceanispirochaeta sp. M2]NPD70563.1 radical SAM protein [Oceanispirochaeta sp. M1]RDG34329.1 radical SAM protein [Oceanispirochaeta sp. M1]
MTILLINPPFCQLNTPYPGTAFLKAWLRKKGHQVHQADTGLETYLRLFSRKGLEEIVFSPLSAESFKKTIESNDSLKRIWQLRLQYCEVIEPVLSFLQGKDSTMATVLCRPGYLPEGERFSGREEEGDERYGSLGITDKARLRATLVLEDLADFYRLSSDENFGFSRYADHLAMSPPSFDTLYSKALDRDSHVSRIHREILKEKMELFKPDMVGFSVPFPGNLLESLRGAAFIKEEYPDVHLTLGGGYINTELRDISDIRISEFFDSLTLDDGEDTMEILCTYLKGENKREDLVRTWLPIEGEWRFFDGPPGYHIKHKERPAPDYSELPMEKYLSLVDRENPMHRLWSEGPWIKMMLAHGCYWKRCAFCDTSLDYIQRFDPGKASVLVDQIEELIESTGSRSFHFVDEAAPPSLMKEMALELIRRRCSISWWTNIRFEKNFTPQLCRLLARSGCIAISGGLEVASDRLLESIDKGVTVSQVSRVAASFRKAGIMVHAYLMYGFPGQNSQELIDSLDVVRQLFMHGLIQSAYWHHFALTAHSPVGLNPEKFGIKITGPQQRGFARNDLSYSQKSEDLSAYGKGLTAALYNYMRGEGFDLPLKKWFSFKIENPRVNRSLIKKIVEGENELELQDSSRLIWYEALPEQSEEGLIFRAGNYQELMHISPGESEFILKLLENCRPEAAVFTLKDFDSLAEGHGINGDSWLSGNLFQELMDYGLLIL